MLAQRAVFLGFSSLSSAFLIFSLCHNDSAEQGGHKVDPEPPAWEFKVTPVGSWRPILELEEFNQKSLTITLINKTGKNQKVPKLGRSAVDHGQLHMTILKPDGRSLGVEGRRDFRGLEEFFDLAAGEKTEGTFTVKDLGYWTARTLAGEHIVEVFFKPDEKTILKERFKFSVLRFAECDIVKSLPVKVVIPAHDATSKPRSADVLIQKVCIDKKVYLYYRRGMSAVAQLAEVGAKTDFTVLPSEDALYVTYSFPEGGVTCINVDPLGGIVYQKLIMTREAEK